MSYVQGLQKPERYISAFPMLSWSPDGKYLAYGGLYDPITIWQESTP